jgi:hypothetical protein
MPFAPAAKHRAKLRIAVVGPSGSGKTYSALRLATGIGGKIGLVDTERKSASLYADRFSFQVNEIEPPYHPAKYIEAIEEAEKDGLEILIIDSLSHAWAGEGGILEQVDNAKTSGNSFTAWGPATKVQNKLIAAILNTNLQIIVTLRAKQEYALEKDARGKTVPKKLGMGPVQRDGVEYEFGTVLDIGMDHVASVGLVGKDRTGLFVGEPHELTEEDGKRIAAWLKNAPEAPPKATAPPKQEPPPVQTSTDQDHKDQLALNKWCEALQACGDDPLKFNALYGKRNEMVPKSAWDRAKAYFKEYADKHKWTHQAGVWMSIPAVQASVGTVPQRDFAGECRQALAPFTLCQDTGQWNAAWLKFRKLPDDVQQSTFPEIEELAKSMDLVQDNDHGTWAIVKEAEVVG